MLLSVVIPCHNEEEVLATLNRRLDEVLQGLGHPYEVVLVDDGSRDSTWKLMVELARRDSHYQVIRLTRNFGHQRALTAGLDHARGDYIVILDADLQDPPELMPEMLRLAEHGYDVVYGQRIERQGEGAFKRGTASLFYRMMNLLVERPIPQDAGDFRLISRRALDMLKGMPEYHRFLRGMIAWIGLPQVALPYVRQARVAGVSKYPLHQMLAFALDAVTGFSTKPLTLASWAGLFSALVGIGLLFFTIYSWYFLDAVPGWASIISAIAIFSSAQLLVLGLIGEYLGRLYEQSKNRPLYLIEETVGSR